MDEVPTDVLAERLGTTRARSTSRCTTRAAKLRRALDEQTTEEYGQ